MVLMMVMVTKDSDNDEIMMLLDFQTVVCGTARRLCQQPCSPRRFPLRLLAQEAGARCCRANVLARLLQSSRCSTDSQLFRLSFTKRSH